ncbi:MAG: DUF2271 domain-containing protein [Oscillospiraceae bacterium]|nr:DUF2271 domain-containing protein [Oscillospiraceae bacterium]
MKKILVISLSAIILLALFACTDSNNNGEPTSTPTTQPPTSSPDGDVTTPQPQASGEVVISLEHVKLAGVASNQYAVWIEDLDGNHITSLYASRWTANGGFRTRPDSLALWVKQADPANMTTSQIDAVSGATPRTGPQTHVWDLTDINGNTVLQGDYKFFVEGTLRWKNFVIFSGVITIGDDPVTVVADAMFHYEGSGNNEPLTEDSVENSMITDVTATFIPKENN